MAGPSAQTNMTTANVSGHHTKTQAHFFTAGHCLSNQLEEHWMHVGENEWAHQEVFVQFLQLYTDIPHKNGRKQGLAVATFLKKAPSKNKRKK